MAGGCVRPGRYWQLRGQCLAASGLPGAGLEPLPKQISGVHCFHGDDGLSELLGQVQSLITILPDTAATQHILNAERLAQLPQGASVINPGRGSLIDEQALLEALGSSNQQGHLRVRCWMYSMKSRCRLTIRYGSIPG